jgi:hypothetical protein
MCVLSEVSRAGYYRHWRCTAPRLEETELRDAIQHLALSHRHYGYRRITALLSREGWSVNHKRVLRLMREDNLLCLRRRTFIPATTDSDHRFRVYPNLARKLETTAVNQLWVADITYVRLAEDFAYLAVVLDAFSRKVVGWAMQEHLKASLALGGPGHGPVGARGHSRRPGPSLRPRGTVCLRRLRSASASPWHRAVDEPGGLPL